MLDSNLMSLLTLLSENDYLTAQTLAVKSGASSRTVQTRIGQLRAELEGHGATVESRQRHGYRLRVEDRNAYETWYNENRHSLASAVPNTVEDRFRFLLACFLDGEEYFKLDDLSEELYVSSKTLSAELRQVEFVLGQYNITLKRKPHYGVRAHGSEFDRRRCYMDYLVQSQNSLFADQRDQAEMLPRIGEVLLDMMIRQRIKFTEAAFQNIVIYLYVAFLRSGAGHLAAAKPGELAQVQAMPEYQAALMLADRLCQAGIEIAPEPAETMYIAIYIAGRRSLGEGYHPQSSPVVQENVNRLTTILLDCVQRVYNLNFRDNLNVRISLYNHIVTFNIRMKYGIQMENPILEEIKQNYPFAFAMAQRAMAEYEKFYSRPVPESETGYFAIILEMALESLKAQIEKKNILLVCMTGKASSRLLAFRFRNEFGVYIDRLDVCSMYEFERYDLSRVDYVFTTVPLQTATAVPIYQIGNFLDASDVPQVRRQLELGSVNFLKDYYRPDLFFPHVQGNTREEVIRQMCQLMGKVYPLPEGFCDSVLEREAMGGTDFGHLVAIPHPADNLVNENVVCVGILDKPVLWSVNKVQLVILVTIYDSASAQTQKFYQLTTALITDEVRVKRIISRRQYLHFMKLFQE